MNDTFAQVKQQTSAFLKANDINRGAAVVSQRAYVSYPVDKTVPQPTKTADGTIGILYHMAMQNGGNTPAFDVRVRLSDNANLGFRRLPPKFSFPNARLKVPVFSATQKEDVTPEIINPHDLVGGPALPLSQEVLRDVDSGKKFVFFWGNITYRDVFKCAHKTEFCVQMVAVLEDGTPVLATCQKHNCADGDCSDFKPSTSAVCKQESDPFPANSK